VKDSLVFTIIGRDRPGLIESLSALGAAHACNWLDSRMSRLAGKFAGMVQVEGDSEQLGRLQEELVAIQGLTVVAEAGEDDTAGPPVGIAISILGLDRPGIVREVSKALVNQGLNVINLETDVSKAAMTGKLMFHGLAQVSYSKTGNIAELTEQLDSISLELGIDIDLEQEKGSGTGGEDDS